MQQNILSSSFNNNGECLCLNCKKEKCLKECSVIEHLNDTIQIRDTNPLYRGKCSECINATLYNANQR